MRTAYVSGPFLRDLPFSGAALSVGSNPDDATRRLAPVLQAAGLPRVRLHDLRHSCASLLLSLGVHAKLVQETLGHSSYQITMDTYSHMIPALRNEVADRMDKVFSTVVSEAVNAPRSAIS